MGMFPDQIVNRTHRAPQPFCFQTRGNGIVYGQTSEEGAEASSEWELVLVPMTGHF